MMVATENLAYADRQMMVASENIGMVGVESAVGGQIFQVGTEVEFFQDACGWRKAIVQAWNHQGGFYVLDIHPNAHPSKVRLCQQAHWGAGNMMATQVLQP